MLKGRTALVTGANGKIGEAICVKLLKENADLVIVCRTKEKSKNLRNKLLNSFPGSIVIPEFAELSDEESIFQLSKRYETTQRSLNILLNVAAECPQTQEFTTTNLEKQFATNVMGYYWVTNAFASLLVMSALKSTIPSRVIFVASYWAGGLDWDDLHFRRREYDSDTAYRQSKQADRMLAMAFSKRLNKENVLVTSCHPGDVNSNLSSSLGFYGHESPEEGADTPYWLTWCELPSSLNGMYFEHRQGMNCKFCKDESKVDKLWKICEENSQYLK